MDADTHKKYINMTGFKKQNHKILILAVIYMHLIA